MFKKISKKHFFLFSSLLALFFLSIPVMQPAQAGFGSIIFKLIGTFVPGVTSTVSLILHLFLVMSWGALIVVSGILEWTLNNPFTYSLTNPATNPIINVGWTLLRDLTNMGFVIGLAYIGLATALNIGGFQTKKTFGRFIVAALLINFTPVICGVIVDASNILMTFFTKEVGSNFNQFATLYGGLTAPDKLQEIFKGIFTTIGVIKILLALAVNTITVIILFVFSFLFLARNVAIWILVIVSPIAFFCWIFDATRSTFNKWWSQFLNWSLIGVLAGFALYLSAFLLNAFQKGGLTNNSGAILDEGQSAFVPLAPFIIVIIFMNFAFIQVMKTSASGGNMAINAAKFTGKQIGSAGKRAGLATQQKLRNYGARLAEKGTGLPGSKKSSPLGVTAGFLARYVSGGGTPDEKKNWNKGPHKAIRGIIAAAYGGPLFGRVLAEGTELQIREDEKFKKKIAGKSALYKDALIAQTVSSRKKALIYQAAQEDGDINDMKNVPKGEKLAEFLANVMKGNAALMAKSLRFLDPKATVEAVNKLGDKLTESQKAAAGLSFSKDDKEEYGDLEGKLLAKMKTAKMEYMDEDAVMRYAGVDKDTGKAGRGHEFWTGAHISKGAELFGRKFIKAFTEGAELADYSNNPRLETWLDSSAARNLGINKPLKTEKLIKDLSEELLEKDAQIATIREQINTMKGGPAGHEHVEHYKDYQTLEAKIKKIEDEDKPAIEKKISDAQKQIKPAKAPSVAQSQPKEGERTPGTGDDNRQTQKEGRRPGTGDDNRQK